MYVCINSSCTYLVLPSMYTTNFAIKSHHPNYTLNISTMVLWLLWMDETSAQSIINVAFTASYCAYFLKYTDTIKLNLLQKLGKFSTHIRNFLHVMQYIHPDMMYTINFISSHIAGTSTSASKGIKNLVLHIAVFMHQPIMYLSGIDITVHHKLRQKTSPS